MDRVTAMKVQAVRRGRVGIDLDRGRNSEARCLEAEGESAAARKEVEDTWLSARCDSGDLLARALHHSSLETRWGNSGHLLSR